MPEDLSFHLFICLYFSDNRNPTFVFGSVETLSVK